MRVSCQSRWPKSIGELVAAASTGAGHHLRDVVELRELLGPDLEVDLEARVARLEHHDVVRELELVERP